MGVSNKRKRQHKADLVGEPRQKSQGSVDYDDIPTQSKIDDGKNQKLFDDED